jgi:transcription elongation factor Elf1
MTATWHTKTPCRKCAAQILVSLDVGGPAEPGLAVFYCPACGERTHVEHPSGYDPLSITAIQALE